MDNRKVTVFSLCFMFLSTMLQATGAVISLVSVPPSTDGLLVANDGDRISLTCIHENSVTFTTRWVISNPVGCEEIIGHLTTVQGDCGTFVIKNVTSESPFSSTAITNATIAQSGASVQCLDGVSPQASGVNITLCVIGELAPPDGLVCQLMSNGVVTCSWNAPAELPACIMDNVLYNVTITRIENDTTEPVITQSTAATTATFNLTADETYIASVTAIIDILPMGESEATSSSNFTARRTVTTIATTTTLLVTSAIDSTTTRSTVEPVPSRPLPFWIWIVVVLGIGCLCVLVLALLFGFRKKIFKFCGKGGTEETDNIALKSSTGGDSIKHEQAPGGEEYAVVETGRSKATEDLGSFYQDPKAIEHEEAPTGDLYAVTEKKPNKGSKKGPSEDELAQMYSVPDKTKKNQGGLNYASIEVSGGGCTAPSQQQLEYATVVN